MRIDNMLALVKDTARDVPGVYRMTSVDGEVIYEHFTGPVAIVLREMRQIDNATIVGTWQASIGPLYARFVSASPGAFHRAPDRGRGQYTLRYMLTRR